MAKTIKQKESKVTVWAEFTDEQGAAVNPDTVTLTIRHPDATTTDVSASVTNPAVGRFEYVLELAQEGTYRWKFTGESAPDDKVVVKGDVDSMSKVDF